MRLFDRVENVSHLKMLNRKCMNKKNQDLKSGFTQHLNATSYQHWCKVMILHGLWICFSVISADVILPLLSSTECSLLLKFRLLFNEPLRQKSWLMALGPNRLSFTKAINEHVLTLRYPRCFGMPHLNWLLNELKLLKI